MEPGAADDPWTLAVKDLVALHYAFTALLERISIVQIRPGDSIPIFRGLEGAE